MESESIRSLFDAIEQNNVSKVVDLLNSDAPMLKPHFRYATEHKSSNIIQAFLNQGWDINTPLSDWEPPALANVVEDAILVDWFLSNGADPNRRCKCQDCTPLSIAVRDAPLQIVQRLFERGGSVKHGQLLHYAAMRTRDERLEVVNLIFDKDSITAMEMLNRIREENTLTWWLNIANGVGTPLHYAALNGSLDLVTYFLDKGADPKIKDPLRKRTPLEWAEFAEKQNVVEYLRAFV